MASQITLQDILSAVSALALVLSVVGWFFLRVNEKKKAQRDEASDAQNLVDRGVAEGLARAKVAELEASLSRAHTAIRELRDDHGETVKAVEHVSATAEMIKSTVDKMADKVDKIAEKVAGLK